MKRKPLRIFGALAGVIIVAFVWMDSVSRATRQRDWFSTGPPPGNPLTPADGPVVENPAPDYNRPSFHVVTPPAIIVGRIKDDLRSELWSIRDALLTETGKLALINPSDELRLFDSKGKVVWARRSPGEGPGDIQYADHLANLRGDTLYLFDQRLRRVTLFDSAGRYIRTSNVGFREAVCCLDDGTALVRGASSGNYRPLTSIPEHATWSTLSTARERRGAYTGPRRSLEGVPVPTGVTDNRELFTVQATDPIIHVGPLRDRRPGGSGHLLSLGMVRPFARTAVVRPAGNVILYARSDRYEYRVYAPTGELLRTVRVAATPIPITKEELEAARAKFIDVDYSEATRAIFASTFDRMGVPTTMPAFGRISTEHDGTVWIQQYRVTADSTQESWARFDSAGKLLGTLQIPAGMRVIRFSRGHVILRSPEDNDGFVELHVNRVVRAPGVRLI